MVNPKERVLRSQYEDVVAQIPGILAAKIQLTEDGYIDHLKVLADPECPPEEIRAQVVGALSHQCGIETTPQMVTVTQENLGREWVDFLGGETVSTEPAAAEQVQEPLRFRLISVHTTVSGMEIEARVGIQFGDQQEEGVVRGPKTSAGRLFMIAAATMQAVSKFLHGKVCLVTEEVVKTKMAQRDSILASITLITEDEEETLLGSVFIKEDESEAVGRAALDAINRRLTQLQLQLKESAEEE